MLKGLRIRLVALVSLAVVPTLGLLLYAASAERDRLLEEGRQQARTLAYLVAQQHQRWVEGAHGLVVGLSRMQSLRALDGEACTESVTPIVGSAPIYANVGAVRPDGQVFCAGAPGPMVNVSDRPFFEGTLRTKKFAAGRLVTSRMLGIPAFGFGYPAYGPDGAVVAVAFASLSVREMQKHLDEVPLESGAVVAVVDRDGIVVSARPQGDTWRGKPFARAVLKNVDDRADTRDLVGPDGVSRTYAAEPIITPAGELAMRVIVGIPTAATHGHVDLIFRRTLLGFGVVALLAIVAAIAVGERLFVRKLKALVIAARKLARGDYSARSGLRPGQEELGQFILSFDQMAQSLENLSRQNRLLLECIGEGIVGMDRDGRIAFSNPAATRILGWSVEEMRGADAHELYHPRSAHDPSSTAAGCLLHGAASAGAARGMVEQQLRRKDGSSFPAECVNTPILDGSALVGSVLVFRDVSEQKKLQEQFQHSQKMEALGQLAGGVAHDFNNLLTAILTCGRFLQEDLGPDHPGRADADQIVASGERAAALTRQLLAVSRRQRLAPRVFSLGEAVQGMEQMLRRVIGEGIHLDVQVSSTGSVEADPAQIEAVILNLVVNARDAMPDGGQLVITVEDEASGEQGARGANGGRPGGPQIVLSVRDTGAGMSPETQARIFEPFFTTKSPGHGTGLGLSMVYGVVVQSGGAIHVKSSPGKGTEFRISLPRSTGTSTAQAVRPPASAAGGSETILVVEDDAVIRGLARRTLTDGGYRVIDASSPSEAVTVARKHQGTIHLLLTDVLLPEQNGWSLSRQIVSLRPAIRTLFMSGYAGNRLDGSAILPPDAPLLSKPFTQDEILRSIRQVLASDVQSQHARGPASA